jgi:NAD+ synthase (glutamine-hydrolysing)
MFEKGMLKVCAVTPQIIVGDIQFNQKSIIETLDTIHSSIAVFPELTVTGYSASDLFYQGEFLEEALKSLHTIMTSTTYQGVYILGMPLDIYGALYNTAVIIQNKKILGVVPKYYIPNHHEFYEKRWFHSGADTHMTEITMLNQTVPFGALIFMEHEKHIRFGVEICQDLWATYAPSDDMSLAGANIIFNLSASTEYVSKPKIREIAVLDHSRKQMGAYVYTSTGVFESTSEVSFSPHQLIAVNGELVASYNVSDIKPHTLYADIDIEGINFLKRQDSTYRDMHFKHVRSYQLIPFHLESTTKYVFHTPLNPLPFIPKQEEEAILEALNLQTLALQKRLLSMPKHARNIVIGISGGLDSTLAILCAHRAVTALHLDPKSIIGVSMPSAVTSQKTKDRAHKIMAYLGVTSLEIPIQDTVDAHLKSIQHEGLEDITFENAQARIRTLNLMDLSNQHQGFVLGTGDLSEIALGFMTYNGDHMSMYAINSGLPKTWIRILVSYYARHIYKDLAEVLEEVIEARVTPELKKNQDTEDTIGRYDINDFMLYHHLVQGADKIKMVFLLKHSYHLDEKEANIYVERFFKLFYQSQFKRQTMPEGPKILTFSLSPRGEYRLPSDVKKT